MLKTAQIILSGAPLIALPALAAEGALQTGITGIGPAKFLFTLAIALFLTLIFRSTANHLARFVTARVGQWRIRTALAKRSPDVLHDFILPGAYGGLAKLDHAILTAGGILCIQTKHYNGVVFGGEEEAQWTNVDGVTRRRFLNPLIQNEGRARALRKVVPEVPVANVVIFSGSVEFTTPPPKNVIHIDQLESYIAKFVFGPSKIDDWAAVWMTVNAAAMVDADTRKDFQAQLGFG
jgi:hypothetical protein